jgi:hypothetical protein
VLAHGRVAARAEGELSVESLERALAEAA